MRTLHAFALALFIGCGSSADETTVAPLPAEELDGSVDVAIDTEGPPIDASVEDAPDPVDSMTAKADATADSAPTPIPDGGTACRAGLTAKGLKFTTTTARGVVDAINIKGPINGVLFTIGTADTPIGDPVACQFAETLWRYADLVKSKGFVKVGTLGSYCYRCCCAWSSTNFCRSLGDPEPDCSANGYSNHSFGRAIDVRYFTKADGTRYDINDPRHFVQYSTTETCTKGIAAQTGISKELYQLACDASSLKIFSIVLTVNYNSVHRNHFHMDIGRTGIPTTWTTKSWDPGYRTDNPPAGEGDDHCGGE